MNQCYPQFDEVCRMFKETFPKCKLIVATNCQYNINDKFRECMKYIDMLYFSIDGYKESYERDRLKWSKLLKFWNNSNQSIDMIVMSW